MLPVNVSVVPLSFCGVVGEAVSNYAMYGDVYCGR
jgi:hypothetical protein